MEVLVVVENVVRIIVCELVVVGDWLELIEVIIVVVGGCGVGSVENFSVVEVLVDLLGVVVGVLCVVVDFGYYLG